MWTCPTCQRVFAHQGQQHSCRTLPLEEHFKNKELAKSLFEALQKEIDGKVGKTKVISLPCCIHLFGEYDFLAAIPKKDRLEIRLGLRRKISSPRIQQVFPLSSVDNKNCIDLFSIKDIDKELLDWIKESYFLKSVAH